MQALPKLSDLAKKDNITSILPAVPTNHTFRAAKNGQWPVIFSLSPINLFELFGEISLEYWLSNFQFCVEVKPANYYSSVSTSAESLFDIKEIILV